MIPVLQLTIFISLVIVPVSTFYGDRRVFPSYETHPCIRTCTIARPQNCYYDFTVEYYFTLSKACYDCPYNKSDCFRPHCVPADGTPRGIVVANRMMPGPAIHVCEGDTVVVRVMNELASGEGTSIHWHGVHQRGTPFMDGAAMVTQCPITQRSTFEYRFNASNPGTHFWHAHSGMQRADGLYGALVVRQSAELEPHHGLYEEDRPEHTLIVHDWFSDLSVNRFAQHHHAGGDHKPWSMLINGMGAYEEFRQNADDAPSYTPVKVFRVTQGTRNRFRIISNGIVSCPIQMSIDNHKLTMIASDGAPFDAIEVDSFNIFPGERYDFVLSAALSVGNYWIRARGLADCIAHKAKQVAILRYEGAPNVEPAGTTAWEDGDRQGKTLNPWNKRESEEQIPVSRLVNRQPRSMVPTFKTIPDKRFYIAMDYSKIDNYLFHDAAYYPIYETTRNKHLYMPQLNHVTNKLPPAPPLTQFGDIYPTQFCHHEFWRHKNCTVDFCECIHLLQADLGDDVELVVVEEGVTANASHPMHVHGYSFYVVGSDKLGISTSVEEVKRLDNQGRIHRNLTHAVAKDTVGVPDGGYTILRLKADNPGFWYFHCHVQFHLDIGMALIIQTGHLRDMPRAPTNFPRCGSWSYTGEPEDDLNRYTGQKCTGGGACLAVTMVIYAMSFCTHMMINT